MKVKSLILVATMAALILPAGAQSVAPGPGVKYATDAYPGFDTYEDTIKPSKKTVGWFRWWSAPKLDTPAEQLAWAEELEAKGSIWRAGRAYNALVAEWPTAPEAPIAQRKLADLRLKDGDYIDACEEYRYLLDFFSSKCDYDNIARIDYEMCEKMREEGKTVMFFRFANTVDVRRAYEALVLRSPGADFVPDAMLTIAELREDEGKLDTAVTVYENLRNLFPKSVQARTAMHREAKVRIRLLDEHGYNRMRIRDTIDFLRLAIRSNCTVDERNDYVAWLADARKALDTATYLGNKFYDSRTRTRRSAINAYKLYLEDYPDGEHAEEARARLAELEAAPVGASVPEPKAESPEKEGHNNAPATPEITADMSIAAPAYRFDPEAPYEDPQAVDETEGEPYWLSEYLAEREQREEAALRKAQEDNKRKWYYLWLAK